MYEQEEEKEYIRDVNCKWLGHHLEQAWPPLAPHYPRCKHSRGSLEKQQPMAG